MSQENEPMPYCDLIMQGGITSGVVYPKVITALSREYNFRNIGGTSAGAIAAGVAAAAEYARVMGRSGEGVGMAGVDHLPEAFENGVLGYFQPVPRMRKLFALGLDLMAVSKSSKPGVMAGIRLLQKHYGSIVRPIPAAAIAILALGAAALAWPISGVSGLLNVALFTGIAATITMGIGLQKLSRVLVGDIVTGLPESRFGICSGRTEVEGETGTGLTDWLADLLDRIAGLAEGAAPLTFRMLKEDPAVGIQVQMMTTNLSMRRPHRLPMETAIFYFEETEFRALFPDRIVEHMIDVARRNGNEAKVEGARTFWPFPGNRADNRGTDSGDELPVVVAIRMSLSFPILIQAVPLYAYDYSVKPEGEERKLTLCLFSDGGVSSNFPMHFFDSFLPVIPTFGVSLDDYDPRRGAKRVTRPESASDGHARSISPFAGLLGFLGRIVQTSKDWQDSLLGELSGYRERIVTVALSSDEGGLNLEMDRDKIARLTGFGETAGRNLLEFDMDEHRWRRFLTAYDKISELVDSVRGVWDGSTIFRGEPMSVFIDRYADQERSYDGPNGNSPEMVRAMAIRMAQIAELGEQWQKVPLPGTPAIPKPLSVMRIRPRE